MKFRKKPVTIDAIQWDGANIIEVLEFIGEKSGYHDKRDNSFTIFTLEGNHKAIVGDWIIRGVKGEYYPCKPAIFEMTYESVREDL